LLALCCGDGVGHQAGDGHRADAAGYGDDRGGVGQFVERAITDDARAPRAIIDTVERCAAAHGIDQRD